jgi:hypothetical protein
MEEDGYVEFVEALGENLDQEYEIDGVEATGFEVLSNMYGLARREEQFQDFYQAFSRTRMLLSNGGFREGSGRVEEAVEEFAEAANEYLGISMTPEEFEADYSYVAAAGDAAIPRNAEKILEAVSGSEGPVTEEEMREIMEDVREEF